MAIDTANRRRSMWGMASFEGFVGPIPDGSLASVADREHFLELYAWGQGAATATLTATARGTIIGRELIVEIDA